MDVLYEPEMIAVACVSVVALWAGLLLWRQSPQK